MSDVLLTAEQAQQIEVTIALSLGYFPETVDGGVATERANKTLSTIRAARAQEQAEQKPVVWSDDIAAMPFNTYCRAIVNWSSRSTCGESYIEGNEAEVIVVKYGMTEGSAYREPKPRFVFLHTGTNQYRDTSVHVLKWKPLYTHPARTKDLTVLRPRNWTREMNDAWHSAIPNLEKAFDDLIAASREKNA